jgi:hypothetical protein
MQAAFMESADLTGADLRGADLDQANLRLATYNDETQWDSHFDPQGVGAVKKRKKWLGIF